MIEMEKCAIYCRLSREDQEHPLKNGSESESIQNQKLILRRHAEENQWLVVSEFVDEDYSGGDNKRPAFCQLLKDAENKKFSIILCKSQSRFTRDMEIVERYLHGYFPIWGIRFVTVVDNTDTNCKYGRKSRQINGLVNQWYLEDLSENIRAVLEEKRRCGQYLGACTVYGYLKNPQNHNHIIPDPVAAPIIKKIFDLYINNNSLQKIANYLNSQNIPNPSSYKESNYMPVSSYKPLNSGMWSKNTISRILKNPIYIGNMVQGRFRKVSYKSPQIIRNPQEKWISVENTHAPIISPNSFNIVQDMLKNKKKIYKSYKTQPYTNIVLFCGYCGKKMNLNCNSANTFYYFCPEHKENNVCPQKSIRADFVKKILLEGINNLIDHFKMPEFRYLTNVEAIHPQLFQDFIKRVSITKNNIDIIKMTITWNI